MVFKVLFISLYFFCFSGITAISQENQSVEGIQNLPAAEAPNSNPPSNVEGKDQPLPDTVPAAKLDPSKLTDIGKDTPTMDTPTMVSKNSNLVDTLMGITLLGSEWVLWLLLILSVVSLTVMFDRMYYFYRTRINFDAFLEKITPLLNAGKEDEVSKICDNSAALEAVIAKEAIASQSQGTDAIEKGTTSYMVRSRTKMEKGLTFLGTMGNNAPFIGLFGTVLGIIQAFEDLSLNPAGGPAVVMAGISEALIATAVGLFVAIPAVIAFNWFGRIVNQKMSNAEAVQNLMMKHYSSK
ncbi:MAG: MotA/TolQ/ExbB proton channel family protein [Oligoflexales bacterium]